MIVVDTNVLAYLLIPGQHTDRAERLLESDPDWAAPRLWRSELRNVFSTYLRRGLLDVADAVALYRRAAQIIGTEEYEVETTDVMQLAKISGCSGYDCEFIALARFLDVPLVTADAKLAKAFPHQTNILT